MSTVDKTCDNCGGALDNDCHGQTMTVEEAQEILGGIIQADDFGLYSLSGFGQEGGYICWNNGDKSICIDASSVSVKELEAVVVWMKHRGTQ